MEALCDSLAWGSSERGLTAPQGIPCRVPSRTQAEEDGPTTPCGPTTFLASVGQWAGERSPFSFLGLVALLLFWHRALFCLIVTYFSPRQKLEQMRSCVGLCQLPSDAFVCKAVSGAPRKLSKEFKSWETKHDLFGWYSTQRGSVVRKTRAPT